MDVTAPMSFGALWLVWILLFVAIEGQALTNKDPNDALSHHVWKWIGRKGFPKPKWYKARRAALGGFLVWLVYHFFVE